MTTETTVTCEARVGYRAGEYAEMPIRCSAVTALTTWTDLDGRTHRACRHHLAALLRRNPEAAEPYVSEVDGDGLAEAKRASEIAREDAYTNGTLTVEWHGHAVDVDLAP